ncbi:MAG TPA: hypothetical protein VFF03_11265 [Rhodocyclaceae bacterium]|nr:hypothetical protein [Rhodocyclaceae bacterium]
MSEARDSQPESPALAMVLFSAGPWRIGIEARWVGGSRRAAADGPGEAIESLLGLPAEGSRTGPCQTLSLKHPEGGRALRVGEPVALAEIPISRLHRLPSLIAARIGLRGARALALADDGQAVLIFDPSRW